MSIYPKFCANTECGQVFLPTLSVTGKEQKYCCLRCLNRGHYLNRKHTPKYKASIKKAQDKRLAKNKAMRVQAAIK